MKFSDKELAPYSFAYSSCSTHAGLAMWLSGVLRILKLLSYSDFYAFMYSPMGNKLKQRQLSSRMLPLKKQIIFLFYETDSEKGYRSACKKGYL